MSTINKIYIFLHFMPERPVDHYARATGWSTQANQEEWLIPFLIPFPNFPHKWREVEQWIGLSKWNSKFWSEYSGWNFRTISSGDPKYSSWKKQKQTFPFYSDRNFWNCWHNGKHPASPKLLQMPSCPNVFLVAISAPQQHSSGFLCVTQEHNTLMMIMALAQTQRLIH